MFGSKKREATAIDPVQKEMIENARIRIKQKRRLFTHFVLFLIGSVGLIIASQVLIQEEIPKILGIDWWIWVIMVWFLLLAYHAFNVFITKRILGPEWEKRQYERLVQKQMDRINKLQIKVDQSHPITEIKPSNPMIPLPKSRTVTMIAAAGENNELGKDGDLVWHLPDDFKRFKALTMGHHIIMGRKTFDGFKKPLPGRTHIVLTRDKNYKSANAIIVHDMETALAATGNDSNPFIIGGGEIYQLGMPFANKIELTRVHGTFDVDTYFPSIDKSQWKLISSESHKVDDRHKYAFDYETWERS